MDLTLLVFQLAVLIFSVIIHEVSHGLAALSLGDTTARDLGRLTLNPFKHLDLFGSIILPLTLFILSHGAFVIGWAKPVPYNPYHLKNPRRAAGLIGLAGPLSNLAIAGVFGLVIRGFSGASPELGMALSYIVFINILLAVFNLVPLPPLDGSNIFFALLPRSWYGIQQALSRYGFWLLIIFIFFGFQLILPIVETVFRAFTGMPVAF